MIYNQDEINELAQSVDLLDYASRSYEFIKRGMDSYACSCPLHVDNTPSLIITPSKNMFYCQSCKRGGNIVTWLMVYEKLPYPKAIEKLQLIAGKTLSDYKPSETMSLLRKYKKAVDSHKPPAPVERQILPYSCYSKYKQEIPQEWLQEGIAPAEFEKYDIRIDEVNNRIVYPVYDKDYHLVGVKGRTRFPNYKELGLQKYINYNKVKTTDYFCGMKEAEPYIKQSSQIIIVEGIKSVMKLDGWGYHNAVAAETSDINASQFLILIQMRISEVIIAFDNDVKLDKIISSTKKLKQYTNLFAVIDKEGLLGEKESPCDKGKEVWEMLFMNRIKIT